MNGIWPDEAPQRFALTIGVFDGVHLGHRRIVERCVELAGASDVPAVALTFDRPPEEIVAPERAAGRLTGLARRVELLREAGLDEVVILGFDEDLAAMEAVAFADSLLDDRGIVGIVVGENFRFGRDAAGDTGLLARRGAKRGVTVIEEPLLQVDGAPVSSTRIRDSLREGDVTQAARMLGRFAELEGIVTSGAGRGMGLGYPTANIAVAPGLVVPADGVYAGRAHWDDSSEAAAISIGTNPTFGGHARLVEAHLLDVSEELLGKEMRLEFVTRVRDQKRFAGERDLTLAIGADIAATRAVLDGLGGGGPAQLAQEDRERP